MLPHVVRFNYAGLREVYAELRQVISPAQAWSETDLSGCVVSNGWRRWDW